MHISIDGFVPESDLKELSEKHKVPGFTYCFIRNGKAEAAKAYGVLNSEKGGEMRPETMFEAASMTKSTFAVIVMRMFDKGLIDLDSPVYKLAPEIVISQDERIKNVTVRQILSHGTGLPNWGDKPNLEFLFSPGESYSYSGEGYYYLHKIVCAMTGKTFMELYDENFFKPLGMKNSAVIWDKSVGERETHKHDKAGQPLEFRDFVDLEGNAPEPNAAWSLYSGAEDYAKFMCSFLNEHCGLSDKAVLEMTTASNKATEAVNWGLGFGIPANEPDIVWHWGDNGGYRSFHCMDLKTKDGVVIFCNGFNGTDLCIDFLNRYTDSKVWDDVADFIAHAE